MAIHHDYLADHRSYVGPPESWDLIAGLCFKHLFDLGLRGHHKLLDVGCGSLRVGRLLIPYLERGNYYGIEPRSELVDEAEWKETVCTEESHFRYNDDFDLSVFGVKFDYILAHSIYSHTTFAQLEGCLASVAGNLVPSGIHLATYYPGASDNIYTEWRYPDIVHFRKETMSGLCDGAGLTYEPHWEYQHPAQRWFVARPS